mmetsp:Transcript_50524/g.86573  ORF Transcript_50524/g.86573 Transcript_50524/m.86573 type:complete len:383 (+) Transcript_50524:165-1313(+)
MLLSWFYLMLASAPIRALNHAKFLRTHADGCTPTQRHSAVLHIEPKSGTSADEDFVRLRNEIRAYENSDLYQRYSNVIPMTVAILRKQHGESSSWWGDLNYRETRVLYWKLLPTVLLVEDEFKGLPLKDRAYVASMARYAAKLYARERSKVPQRAAAGLFDGTRYALKTGRWSWTGMSVEEIWLKYEAEIKAEMLATAAVEQARRSADDECDVLDSEADAMAAIESAAAATSVSLINEDELYRRLYQKILRKSCATNPVIDALALKSLTQTPAQAQAASSPTSSSTATQLGDGELPGSLPGSSGSGLCAAVVVASGRESSLRDLDEAERGRRVAELLRTARARRNVRKWMKGMSTKAMLKVLAATSKGKRAEAFADGAEINE